MKMTNSGFLHYIQKGAAANLPVAASVAAYGGVLGVLAAQKQISWPVLLLMNLTIFAGSAQFVMVDLWAAPLPILEIILAAAVINLRYLLIGASLNPIFQGSKMFHKFFIMHFVADENWAVAMAFHRRGSATPAFLLGGGICLAAAWCFGTLTGHRLGAVIHDPAMFAMDFAFLAVFTALAVSLWRGKKDVLPWLAAAAVSIGAAQLFPGKWYIAVGGFSGALAAVLRQWQRKERP
jgi:predicted branched-subunit amino acid permease